MHLNTFYAKSKLIVELLNRIFMKTKLFFTLLGLLVAIAIFLGPSYYLYKKNLELIEENYSLKQKIVLQEDLIEKQNDIIFWKDSLNNYLRQRMEVR